MTAEYDLPLFYQIRFITGLCVGFGHSQRRFRIRFCIKTKLFVCKIHIFWVIKSYRLLTTDLSVLRSVYDFNKFQKQIFQKASKYLQNATSNNEENLSIH